ncbi:MAG: hypothetical protein HYU41_26475 [Candidatus Rokubacteria bacterium]|nr:hypothetical protein [Candidatus Rokubacteria bacterium]
MMITDAPTASRVRYLVVVRRGDDSTYRYLKERLASVRDVEITIDRRGTAEPAADERRRKPAPFNAFGVCLVRR